METAIKGVRLPGGVQLPYAEQGDPTGVPMVLLHGVTDTWYSFAPVLPHLPPSVRAFALTQRGHGDADRPADGYRTRDFAADVARFVETLGLGPVVIVGHSLGSTNALRFAIDYPKLVRGVVLAGAFAGYGCKPDFTDFYETDIAPLEDPIDPEFVRRFQESTLARPVPEEFLETVVQESLKAPARVWRAALAGCMEDDFVGELGRIAAPTLILWGERDAYCPRGDQDALLAAIAGSRLTVYRGAGHALHWEEPERFAADLTRFVRELSDEAKQSGHRAIGSVRASPMAAQAVPQ